MHSNTPRNNYNHWFAIAYQNVTKIYLSHSLPPLNDLFAILIFAESLNSIGISIFIINLANERKIKKKKRNNNTRAAYTLLINQSTYT